MNELHHDESPDPTLLALMLLSLTKDMLAMFTLFAMRLSWTMMVLWWVVWTSFVSPDRIRTAPQLNSSEAIEQRTGTVIVAGEWIVWVVEVLPFRPAQVSFSWIVPRNSRRNVSEIASDHV